MPYTASTPPPPPLIGELKKKEEKGEGKGLVCATTHNLPLITTFNVQKLQFWYTNFQKSPYRTTWKGNIPTPLINHGNAKYWKTSPSSMPNDKPNGRKMHDGIYVRIPFLWLVTWYSGLVSLVGLGPSACSCTSRKSGKMDQIIQWLVGD